MAVVFPVKAQSTKHGRTSFRHSLPPRVQSVESIVPGFSATAVQIASIDTWQTIRRWKILLIVGLRGRTKDQNDRQRNSNEERAAFEASSIKDSAKTCRRHTGQNTAQETPNIWYSSSICPKNSRFRSQTSNISSGFSGKEAATIYASSGEEVRKLIGKRVI